ncbi:hypothetical protein [Deinococcus yavapaiensis]|nr:hypothetical protein [Deinococcus yavapaiensis]
MRLTVSLLAACLPPAPSAVANDNGIARMPTVAVMAGSLSNTRPQTPREAAAHVATPSSPIATPVDARALDTSSITAVVQNAAGVVNADAPIITLSAVRLPVVTGAAARLGVTIDRRGVTGPVTISLDGLPTGAKASSVVIPSAANTADVTVTATRGAPHSRPTTATLHARFEHGSVSRAVVVTVRGAAGSLDTTFGTAGVAVTKASLGESQANAMAVLPDGKIVVVGEAFGQLGDFMILRYDRDGILDSSFGTNGKVVVDFEGGRDVAEAVVVQPDGKVIVGGSASSSAASGRRESFAAVRLTSTGKLDASFGTNGKVTIAFPDSSVGKTHAVALQPDGKIVLGGEATFVASGVDFALARLTPTGTLDASFGTNGRVTTPVLTLSETDRIFALALQGDKIVAAGGGKFQVVRYTSNGALDSTFGSDGKVADVFGSSSSATSALVDRDGRVLLAGERDMNTVVVRLNTGGVLDTTFGSRGVVEVPLSSTNWDKAAALVSQTDGKIVVGGWVNEGQTSSGNFAVTRLTAGGALDATFGRGGTTITPVALDAKADFANAAALQSDDRIPAVRIVLAGARSADGLAVALTRYWP